VIRLGRTAMKTGAKIAVMPLLVASLTDGSRRR
jgi:hypothetical protein